MLKKISLQDAVGTQLAHDITEIRPGEFKGAAFRKGHTVCNEDICRLQKLGKDHLYVIDLAKDEIHENEAAAVLAGALAGEGVVWENNPKEGKIGMKAAIDGLLSVNTAALDDADLIRQAIVTHLENGCDLLLLSGGMSVDPDDVTRMAIRQTGATGMHYGASALPGAMFLVAWIGDVPLLGVPACGLYHRTTVLDLVLPRILAGERIGKKELAFFGHGGLCQDCPECVFPNCAFGKGA